MRMPKYLSPTSIKMFYGDRDAFYLQYLSNVKTVRPPQTLPMSVGSAFDAFVKSFLVERLVGKRPEFEMNTIFEQQVEPHNRDQARVDGKLVFDMYNKLGALSDLLLDLEGCVGEPRFETSIEGYVSSVSHAVGDVPLLGKPDIYFITKSGARIIFDWKVNGFYSGYNMSPKPGYIRMRSSDSKENGKVHPKAVVMMDDGMKLSITHPLDTVEQEWAAQLSIYSWLLGQDVGSKFVVAIDQIVCNKDMLGNRVFRIAQHRSRVTTEFQTALFEKANKAWYAIQAEHPFFELSKEENDIRCATLEAIASTPRDQAFDDFMR